jgi:SAM-dependent methyltransferase
MAHQEQREFFERLNSSLTTHFNEAMKILEVGSQNINGTVRHFFPAANNYLGIDLGIADSVDWVIPGELIELPDGWADITVSTECFEHCRDWNNVMLNMIRITKSRGLVIITCAGSERPTHGTIDSDEESSPFTTSYYKNLNVDDISTKIKLGAYFDIHGFEVNSVSKDTYFWGIRSESSVNGSDYYWEDPLSRLARAQGQLSQAAARHALLRAELNQTIAELNQERSEAEQAKLEAKQAKLEAEQARLEAEQARLEAEQAKLETEQARLEAEQARLEAEQAKLETEQATLEAEQAKAFAQEASARLNNVYTTKSWRHLKAWHHMMINLWSRRS